MVVSPSGQTGLTAPKAATRELDIEQDGVTVQNPSALGQSAMARMLTQRTAMKMYHVCIYLCCII